MSSESNLLEDYLKLAQQPPQGSQGQMGSLLGGGMAAALQGGGFCGTTAQIPAYDKIYTSMVFKQPESRMFSFFRINQKVDITEMNVVKKRFIEPLDELRLKVSKWLYN